MNSKQKATIQHLRSAGRSYTDISEATGLPAGTVKAYCSRNGIRPSQEDINRCAFCGKGINPSLGHKPRRFCSDTCRYRWWGERSNRQAGKAATLVCSHCGMKYASNRKSSKYCSHPCYIAQRFGKGIEQE